MERIANRPNVLFDIEEMFELRRQGWTLHQLASKYHRDHSTILYHCHRYEVYPHGVKSFKFVKKVKQLNSSPGKYIVLDYRGDIINQGKSYREYLQDEIDRKNNLLKKLIDEKQKEVSKKTKT